MTEAVSVLDAVIILVRPFQRHTVPVATIARIFPHIGRDEADAELLDRCIAGHC